MRKAGAGGRGGDASVEGNDSFAEGGGGGEAVIGDGGRGGDARVKGVRSFGKGGQGGRGGVVAGQPGMDVEAFGDNMFVAGGTGGEAPQADGRGGRGGPSYVAGQRSTMKLPYWAPNNFPGRGGDGVDTVQYTARRLIVEDLKARHLNLRPFSSDDIWYDRTTSADRLNELLEDAGHRWRVRIVSGEYEFWDL